MIRARQNKVIHWIFHRYVTWLTRGHFHGVKFNPVEVDPKKSILLLANHIGWWDGFVFYQLNYLLFKKRFHIMVLEDTVKKAFFFKYMGAFSIVKSSREMLTSLNYAAGLLNDPQNLVLIFPQGRLYSNFVDQVNFEKGLMRVVQPAAGKFQCVFAAQFIENFQHKKPTVHLYLKCSREEAASAAQLEEAYQQHYSLAKLQQTQIVL